MRSWNARQWMFPQGQLAGVEEFRRRWDPLSGSIPAHVTLVFPISRPRPEHSLARELAAILEEFPPFALSLSEVRVWEQQFLFLFLVPGRGGEQITRLHDALYDGPFRHARRPAPFVPHMTIGRCPDCVQAAAAAASAAQLGVWADATAAAVGVYRITAGGQRSRTLEIPLRGSS